ncbi:MAG: DUF1203 domain-containing protein [Pseudomonadota bacterium]
MNFRINALEGSLFSRYFSLSAAELEVHGGRLFTADKSPEYPCRVSLTDASVGETVLALPFCHHPVSGPYRSSGPVFVRANPEQATPAVNEIPELLRHRLLSVRGYDAQHMMIEADSTMGAQIESVLRSQFANDGVAYIHIHYAQPGCFSCAVQRV